MTGSVAFSAFARVVLVAAKEIETEDVSLAVAYLRAPSRISGRMMVASTIRSKCWRFAHPDIIVSVVQLGDLFDCTAPCAGRGRGDA